MGEDLEEAMETRIRERRARSDTGHEEAHVEVETHSWTCPECGVITADPFKHLKFSHSPEPKVVEVEKVKKISLREALMQHDFFECEECMKMMDEHLAKKGLEIRIVKVKEGFWGPSEEVVYPKKKEEDDPWADYYG